MVFFLLVAFFCIIQIFFGVFFTHFWLLVQSLQIYELILIGYSDVNSKSKAFAELC